MCMDLVVDSFGAYHTHNVFVSWQPPYIYMFLVNFLRNKERYTTMCFSCALFFPFPSPSLSPPFSPFLSFCVYFIICKRSGNNGHGLFGVNCTERERGRNRRSRISPRLKPLLNTHVPWMGQILHVHCEAITAHTSYVFTLICTIFIALGLNNVIFRV